MVITWYGLSCFRISSGELTVGTDPFSKDTGLAAPRGATQVTIVSNSNNPYYNNWQSLGGPDAFVIDSSGEYDLKGLVIRGIAATGDPKAQKNGFDLTTIYSIRMEDMRLGFLGSLNEQKLSDQQLEELGDIDILFVGVGGHVVCDAEQAVTIVNQIEPKIVIPMHYAQKGLKLQLDKVEVFLKEIGSTKVVPIEKLTLKKSGIPEGDKTDVVVLEPTR